LRPDRLLPVPTQDHLESSGVFDDDGALSLPLRGARPAGLPGLLPPLPSPTTGRCGPGSRSEPRRREVIVHPGTTTTTLRISVSETRPARSTVRYEPAALGVPA